ncbi:diguanylate cyclase [Diaphorobacter sp.]|uniref:GGDEF domain-containing protein n=1 Tax=Diaphorobacter sp. TaxID=1934310 RepID=UPI00258F5950|nr:diguanylate cyclase [Diaphorobacter sp.]
MQPPLPASSTQYAQQLRQGFRWLRFGAALEAEYRAYCGRNEHRRVLWFSAICLVMWGGYSLFDLWRIDAALLDVRQQALLMSLHAVRVAVTAVIVLTLACALWRSPMRVLQAVLIVLGVTLSCGAAFSVYAYKVLGAPNEPAVLVMVMLGVFSPFAVSPWVQLLVALLYLACVGALAWAAPLPEVRAQMLRLEVVLALSALVFGFVAYWREHQRREQFLYRGDAHWLAMRDALTGLYNRRMFNHHIGQLVAQAQREGQPLALLLMDVDYFKSYNDNHGHQQGDVVLQQVAQVVLACIGRPLDLVARVGGEEFAVLLYGSSAEHAQALGQSLVAGVRQRALPHAASPVAQVVTVSVGGAMLSPQDQPRTLYARADRMLYEAKNGGRDRCCWAQTLQA